MKKIFYSFGFIAIILIIYGILQMQTSKDENNAGEITTEETNATEMVENNEDMTEQLQESTNEEAIAKDNENTLAASDDKTPFKTIENGYFSNCPSIKLGTKREDIEREIGMLTLDFNEAYGGFYSTAYEECGTLLIFTENAPKTKLDTLFYLDNKISVHDIKYELGEPDFHGYEPGDSGDSWVSTYEKGIYVLTIKSETEDQEFPNEIFLRRSQFAPLTSDELSDYLEFLDGKWIGEVFHDRLIFSYEASTNRMNVMPTDDRDNPILAHPEELLIKDSEKNTIIFSDENFISKIYFLYDEDEIFVYYDFDDWTRYYKDR